VTLTVGDESAVLGYNVSSEIRLRPTWSNSCIQKDVTSNIIFY